jgi:hypothetical protein
MVFTSFWGLHVTTRLQMGQVIAHVRGMSENADLDVVISNIYICIMWLSLLSICIRIILLLSASTQLLWFLNAVIIHYSHMK